MYAAIDLSKYIVANCIKDCHPISNLQLQKILYYVQKEFLNKNKVAFPDEIEAWQFGPVVPNVYYHFCGFGAMPISVLDDSDSIIIDSGDKLEIDGIIKAKRALNPWDMVEETHKADGAWAKIFSDGIGNRQVIPISLIKEIG